MNVNYTSINQMRDQLNTNKRPKIDSQNSQSTQTFEELLFSKHASQRLETRNIDISPEQQQRLQDATSQAREKGMKESLVLVDDMAFIVNIKNNTVVTAVNDTSHAVFTNIDGAIIN